MPERTKEKTILISHPLCWENRQRRPDGGDSGQPDQQLPAPRGGPAVVPDAVTGEPAVAAGAGAGGLAAGSVEAESGAAAGGQPEVGWDLGGVVHVTLTGEPLVSSIGIVNATISSITRSGSVPAASAARSPSLRLHLWICPRFNHLRILTSPRFARTPLPSCQVKAMFARVEIAPTRGRVPIGETKRTQEVQRFQQRSSLPWCNLERPANTGKPENRKVQQGPSPNKAGIRRSSHFTVFVRGKLWRAQWDARGKRAPRSTT